MSKVAGCKRKLKTRTVTEKYEILKEIDKGESSASSTDIVMVVKTKSKNLFACREKQKFWKKSHDVSLPL